MTVAVTSGLTLPGLGACWVSCSWAGIWAVRGPAHCPESAPSLSASDCFSLPLSVFVCLCVAVVFSFLIPLFKKILIQG